MGRGLQQSLARGRQLGHRQACELPTHPAANFLGGFCCCSAVLADQILIFNASMAVHTHTPSHNAGRKPPFSLGNNQARLR